MSAFLKLTHISRESVVTHTEGHDFIPYTERRETRKPLIVRKSLVRSVWENNTCRTMVIDQQGATDRYDVAESFEQIAAMLEAE